MYLNIVPPVLGGIADVFNGWQLGHVDNLPYGSMPVLYGDITSVEAVVCRAVPGEFLCRVPRRRAANDVNITVRDVQATSELPSLGRRRSC